MERRPEIRDIPNRFPFGMPVWAEHAGGADPALADVVPERAILVQGGKLEDTVAVDAKRILLRYGTPISILDKISEEERIGLARTIARTTLPEREQRLRELLTEAGHLEVAS